MCCAFVHDMPVIIHCLTVLDDETARQLREMNSKVSWPSGLNENVLLRYKTLYFPGKLCDLPQWYVLHN